MAQEAKTKTFPSPNAIVDAADASEWVEIKASDLMVMELAPDRDGKVRRVIIQLMPKPFSQGWVRNIRKLAAAKYWDDTAIIRVQDNYVTQWGDPYSSREEFAKPLPEGLEVIGEEDYTVETLISTPDSRGRPRINYHLGALLVRNAMAAASVDSTPPPKLVAALDKGELEDLPRTELPDVSDRYANITSHLLGWPIAGSSQTKEQRFWPVHCYGMVGVGRDLSPNTGDGSSLYTVIGHAPRHLDRNIALVGRIISGMEHMSSLPRGTGDLGFYETPEEQTKIVSVRIGKDVSNLPCLLYTSPSPRDRG